MKFKRSKLFIVVCYLIFFLVLISLTFAEEVVRDVEISIILDDPYPNLEYDSLFRVENLDHISGTTDLLHFFINASLFNISLEVNESVFTHSLSWNATRSINKFTQSGMGFLNLSSGVYKVCVSLTPLNFIDDNLSNNAACAVLSTNDYDFYFNESFEYIFNESMQIPDSAMNNESGCGNCSFNESEEDNSSSVVEMCECALQIVTEKLVFNEGESVSFIINDCWDFASFKFPIKYWAEDLFNEITKPVLVSSSKAPKSYTPRIASEEKSFFLKAKVEGCNITSSKLLVVKGLKKEIPETSLNISTTSSASSGETIIMDVVGFKGSTLKTLVNVYLELNGKQKSDVLKFYVTKQNQEFNFKIPFIIPSNLPSGIDEYDLVFEGLDLKKSIPLIIDVPQKEIVPFFSINNVYTRKQKFDGSLVLMVSWEAEQDAYLNVHSSNSVFDVSLNKSPESIPLNISFPDELIVVELMFEDEVEDVSFLKLNLSVDEDFFEEELLDEISEEVEFKNTSQNSSIIGIEETIKGNSSSSLLSSMHGEGSYENKSSLEVDEEFKNLNYTSKVSSFFSNNSKQSFFILLVLVSFFFLFKKELIGFFKKLK